MVAVADRIEKVLRSHRYLQGGTVNGDPAPGWCSCGARWFKNRSEHDTHLAAALREAGIGDLAQAWDEGHAEPRECCGSCPRGSCPWDAGRSGPTNPYRKGGSDE